jgi:hypothetical protein
MNVLCEWMSAFLTGSEIPFPGDFQTKSVNKTGGCPAKYRFYEYSIDCIENIPNFLFLCNIKQQSQRRFFLCVVASEKLALIYFYPV